MGDKLLKKVLLICLFIISSLFAIPTKERINTLVEQIKPPRTGLSHKTLSVIKNPFIIIKTSTKGLKKGRKKVYSRSYNYSKRRIHFKLYATLNKSAKINNRWIALNSKLSNYTLRKITKEYVVMQKGNSKPIMVYLNSKNKKIHLMTK